MATYNARIRLDAENKQIILDVVDASGNQVSAWGQIKLPLGKDPGTVGANPGTNLGQAIELRETRGCDPTTGDARYCIVLRSPWYETPLTSNPDA